MPDSYEFLKKQYDERMKKRHAATVEPYRAALELLYDKWENGAPCYADADSLNDYLGNAFRLSEDEENKILKLIQERE